MYFLDRKDSCRGEKTMALTTSELAQYLGKHVSTLLRDQPFDQWVIERSIEADLDPPLIDYVFPHDGLDIVCDADDSINCLFLYAGDRQFSQHITDLPFTSTRREVLGRLGVPSKTGGVTHDPILGESGAWDRFARPGHDIHIQYRLDTDLVAKITLMRSDVTPP
jgi:hypothetical protein